MVISHEKLLKVEKIGKYMGVYNDLKESVERKVIKNVILKAEDLSKGNMLRALSLMKLNNLI
jgi:hypothetical protein